MAYFASLEWNEAGRAIASLQTDSDSINNGRWKFIARVSPPRVWTGKNHFLVKLSYTDLGWI
ncbi:MAG: hypothetical protein AB4040_06915 [Synechococcus sp.]